MSAGRVVLVTGASRGMGRELAEELCRRGHRVYGGARTWPETEGETGFIRLVLDVTDEESVKKAVARIMAEQGRLEILVNNAGVSHGGSVEDTPLEVAREMFETNYLGPVRLIRAALPIMRRQGSGLIVNVGSAAGKIGIPFQAHYVASKFALEGLSEALRDELLAFGLRVLLIEPGDVRTTIWEKNQRHAPESSPYFAVLQRFFSVKDQEMGERATPPQVAAREIADVIESNTTRLRHPVAKGARLILFARKLLPDRLFLWLVANNYKVAK